MKELTLLKFKRKRVDKFQRILIDNIRQLPKPIAVVGTVDTSHSECSDFTIKPEHISSYLLNFSRFLRTAYG